MVDLNRYLTIVHDDTDALAVRGSVKRQLGRAAEAVPDFDRALQLDPNSFATYLERSKAFLALGKTNEALKDARLAKEHGITVDTRYISTISPR